MSQVGRISGPLLTANLERNGINLAFRNTSFDTQLLFLDVNNGKIGVNKGVSGYELDVSGISRLPTLIATDTTSVANYTIENNTLSILGGELGANIYLNASTAILMANMETGTIRISDNIISTIISNADIDLTAGGTGTVEIVNNLNVFGNIHSLGDITFDGTIVLGDQTSDTVDFNSVVTSNIVPDQGSVYNIGSNEKRWAAVYTNLLNGAAVSVGELAVGGLNIDHRDGGKIYVAQNGNDSAKGDHILDPFATIARALQAAEASGEQPFVIYVSAGEYQEALPLVVPPNVTIIGADIRNVIIGPDTSSQSQDVFHLSDSTTISNLTIKNVYYDNINNTGYAFRFAPNAIITNRSPYIQGISVITQETSEGAGDAGRGAWIDGSELNSLSVEATMLFHSCTFISPGADVINMTNGVRVEWLNSFTYFANRGLYAFAGLLGRTSYDGSTINYGAELRSIGSANVYGNYGAVADGAGTLMYLIEHNFGYIGSGNSSANDPTEVIQANEVVELNSGQIHYVSTDQLGNFRVGDNFFVDLKSGNTSLTIDSGNFDSLSGLVINTTGQTTFIDGNNVDTGNINITANNIISKSGDLNLIAATNILKINDNTNINGNLVIRDNFSFSGTLNLAGDQTTDAVDFNINFEQNFNPHLNLVHNLGTVEKQWLNVYLNRAEIGNIVIDENYISTDVSNADLELRSNNTSEIIIPNNNLHIDNNLTVSNFTNILSVNVQNTVTQSGNRNQTGDHNVTNYTITKNLDAGSQIQFKEIIFDGNVITPITNNTDLELRANGTGKILVPNEDVNIINSISVGNIFNNDNINVSLQTNFNEADISDITITQNYITTNVSNADLELRANGTGDIKIYSDVTIDNNFTVNTDTSFKNSFFTYEYGPELVVNGTFNTNLNSWTAAGGGTAIVSANSMLINASTSARNMSQAIAVQAGKSYIFSINVVNATLGVIDPADEYYVRVFEPGVGTLLEWNDSTLEGSLWPITLTDSFFPSTSAVSIIIRASNAIIQVDNISVIEDIGLVETIIPVTFNLENIDQTSNTAITGDYDQTGDTDIDGNLTVGNEITTTNFNINANILQNFREDLRLNNTTPFDPLSLPQIVKAMQQDGATADDYSEQTEKNLVNFLANGTTAPYAYSYIDTNSNGIVTSGDALSWLQYVANGSSPDPVANQFIKDVVELLLEDEFSNPGKYNSNLFLGDYYRADFKLQASGTGRVTAPANDVRITNNLFAASIFAADINIAQDLDLNEIIITDSIIEIDDNFIATTISNENLELRAQKNIVIKNSAVINQQLSVNTDAQFADLLLTGTSTHTGNRNQTGNLNVIGNVTVTTSNIQSEIQFEDIVFNDNYLETTLSNADLELRANGVGVITIPENNVRIINDVSLGTLDSVNVNISSALQAEEFELSSNIKLFDNVITTTNTNSNLELRTVDSRITLENFRFKDTNVQTVSSDIDFNVNGNLIIAATGAINIPVGTTAQRKIGDNRIRFNSTNNIFEAFNNSNTVSFNGVYSANRLTSVLAHPTNNTINFNITGANAGQVNNNGLTVQGIITDDISLQTTIVRTTLSNSDLELRTDGSGKLEIYSTTLVDNIIQNNNTSGPLTFKNNSYGRVKFNVDTAVAIPYGNTESQMSYTPEMGLTRWNTEESILETWDGNTYISAAGIAATINAEEMNDLILEYTLIFG